MGDAWDSGGASAVKGLNEFFAWVAHFIAAESKGADAIAKGGDCPVRRDESDCGWFFASNIHRQGHIHAELALCPRAGAVDSGDLVRKSDSAVFVNGVRGVGDFGVFAILSGLSREKFARDELDVIGRFEAGRNGGVDLDKVRKVAVHIPFAQTF